MPKKTIPPPAFILNLHEIMIQIGIGYITKEHIRQAKKNVLEETDLMWKALHDMVMLIKIKSLKRSEEIPDLQMAWNEMLQHEPDQKKLMNSCREIVQYYLYHEGHASEEMLLALAWLLAKYNAFHLNRKNRKRALLPPYPENVSLSKKQLQDGVINVLEQYNELQPREFLSRTDQIQYLHVLHGRLRCQLKRLHEYSRCWSMRAQKLKTIQRPKDDALSDKSRDVTLSCYELQLLRHPQLLQAHLQALTSRISQYEDEKTFYEWISTLFRSSKRMPPSGLKAVEANDKQEASAKDPTCLMEKNIEKVIEQIEDALQDRKSLRVQITQNWKTTKELAGNAEYRRKKHKLKTMSEKLDPEFPNYAAVCQEMMKSMKSVSHGSSTVSKTRAPILSSSLQRPTKIEIQQLIEPVLVKLLSTNNVQFV